MEMRQTWYLGDKKAKNKEPQHLLSKDSVAALYRVFLNGEEIEQCIEFDEKEGYIIYCEFVQSKRIGYIERTTFREEGFVEAFLKKKTYRLSSKR
jgi:hypothetical protein